MTRFAPPLIVPPRYLARLKRLISRWWIPIVLFICQAVPITIGMCYLAYVIHHFITKYW